MYFLVRHIEHLNKCTMFLRNSFFNAKYLQFLKHHQTMIKILSRSWAPASSSFVISSPRNNDAKATMNDVWLCVRNNKYMTQWRVIWQKCNTKMQHEITTNISSLNRCWYCRTLVQLYGDKQTWKQVYRSSLENKYLEPLLKISI